MVRSLRAGLDQYQDPNVQRQIEQIMAQKVPNNPVKGVQYIFDRYLAGELRRKDRKQRTAASGALTTGSENQTKIIDAIKAQKAVEARPAMGKVSNQELYEMDAAPGGVNANRELYEHDGGWSNFEDAAPAMAAREASPEIKAQMARIDPNSGALYGRSQALAELLRTNPDNPYAQGALLDNAGQLSNRNANLQLQQMKNQNALSTLAGTRAYQANLAEVKRRNELEDAQTEFGMKKKLEEIKLGGKDTRTNLMKNLQAQGLKPGTKLYQDAMAAGLKKGPLVQQVGESAYKKEMGKIRAQKYGKIIESRDDAAKTNFYLSQALAAIDDPIGVASAFTNSIGTFATQLGLRLGDKWEKKLTASQKFQGLMGNILAAKLALQKGPQTNEDANRMERTMANLGNTKEARIFFIKSMTALNNRTIEKAAFYENWETQKGSIKGAEKEWQKSISKMPLIAIRKTADGGNQPILYNEFLKESQKANPAYSNSEIKEIWIKRYGP